MIIGLWHPGSGVGDQIFSYLATRTLAERLDVGFTMVGEFKADFIDAYRGLNVDIPYTTQMPEKKLVVSLPYPVYEPKLPHYDPEFNFLDGNVIVDGTSMQDERYWDLEKVREWLPTKPLDVPDDMCVINFRGGEFVVFPELFLTKDYWDEAIRLMGDKRFEVHTDDEGLARHFFPDFPVIHDVNVNWRSIRYAKHSILANSAFGVIPALLSGADVIAPRYWARRNIKEWATPQNYYKQFTYL